MTGLDAGLLSAITVQGPRKTRQGHKDLGGQNLQRFKHFPAREMQCHRDSKRGNLLALLYLGDFE